MVLRNPLSWSSFLSLRRPPQASFEWGINIEAMRAAKWTTCSLVYPSSQRLIPRMPSIINHYPHLLPIGFQKDYRSLVLGTLTLAEGVRDELPRAISYRAGTRPA